MTQTNIKELTLDSFADYGTFRNMIDPDTPVIGEKPIQFFRDMLQLELGTAARASFSICRVEKRPLVVDTSEYHNNCGEGLLPLDSDILIHVAAATPDELDTETIEVFHVPKGTMVVLDVGVWHHAPFAYGNDSANVLVVLPERTYKKDCYVTELPRRNQVEIKE
jgi:ureidoglycolate lyase